MGERSKTVDQALVVLRSLGEDGSATVTDLARRSRLNRTVVHRLLASLQHAGLARRDPRGHWTLGIGLLELSGRIADDVRRAARPALESLADRYGETTVISLPDGDDVVALDEADGERHPLRVSYGRGVRHPQFRSAHGRAILALRAAADVERVLAGVPEPTVLAERLEQVRRLGYATSRDELQLGAAGLAAPVLDPTGHPVASIGLVAPATRMPDPDELAPAVIAAADAVAINLTRSS